MTVKTPLGRTSAITVDGCAASVAARLRDAARKTLAAEGVTACRLDVSVLNDEAMTQAHLEWLGKDEPTDVLTFDLGEPGAGIRDVHAQILVCADVARRKAAELGHDWRDELMLYVVHGCLHLCGYDDERAADFRRMHRREDELLESWGLGPLFGGRVRGPRGHQPSRRTGG